jgi:hypothetical protein
VGGAAAGAFPFASGKCARRIEFESLAAAGEQISRRLVCGFAPLSQSAHAVCHRLQRGNYVCAQLLEAREGSRISFHPHGEPADIISVGSRNLTLKFRLSAPVGLASAIVCVWAWKKEANCCVEYHWIGGAKFIFLFHLHLNGFPTFQRLRKFDAVS